jgi:hypothetical protein
MQASSAHHVILRILHRAMTWMSTYPSEDALFVGRRIEVQKSLLTAVPSK